MTIAQYYKLQIQGPELCQPGALVYENNDSDCAIGFIYKLAGDIAEVVLFRPLDITCYVEIMELPHDWTDMLNELMTRASPDIQNMWTRLVHQ